MCSDCHSFSKLVSRIYDREIIIRVNVNEVEALGELFNKLSSSILADGLIHKVSRIRRSLGWLCPKFKQAKIFFSIGGLKKQVIYIRTNQALEPEDGMTVVHLVCQQNEYSPIVSHPLQSSNKNAMHSDVFFRRQRVLKLRLENNLWTSSFKVRELIKLQDFSVLKWVVDESDCLRSHR